MRVLLVVFCLVVGVFGEGVVEYRLERKGLVVQRMGGQNPRLDEAYFEGKSIRIEALADTMASSDSLIGFFNFYTLGTGEIEFVVDGDEEVSVSVRVPDAREFRKRGWQQRGDSLGFFLHGQVLLMQGGDSDPLLAMNLSGAGQKSFAEEVKRRLESRREGDALKPETIYFSFERSSRWGDVVESLRMIRGWVGERVVVAPYLGDGRVYTDLPLEYQMPGAMGYLSGGAAGLIVVQVNREGGVLGEGGEALANAASVEHYLAEAKVRIEKAGEVPWLAVIGKSERLYLFSRPVVDAASTVGVKYCVFYGYEGGEKVDFGKFRESCLSVDRERMGRVYPMDLKDLGGSEDVKKKRLEPVDRMLAATYPMEEMIGRPFLLEVDEKVVLSPKYNLKRFRGDAVKDDLLREHLNLFREFSLAREESARVVLLVRRNVTLKRLRALYEMVNQADIEHVLMIHVGKGGDGALWGRVEAEELPLGW